MPEIELNVIPYKCLNRRIDGINVDRNEAMAKQYFRNNKADKINWQFTTEDARLKLLRVYSTFTN